MDKENMAAVASALHSIAHELTTLAQLFTNNTIVVKPGTVTSHLDKLFVLPESSVRTTKVKGESHIVAIIQHHINESLVPNPDNPNEMDDFWFGTLTKQELTLNHRLNKVNKDWEVNNIRTPKGARALREVAADCKLDPILLSVAMLEHPRFSRNLFGDAALQLLEKEWLDSQESA